MEDMAHRPSTGLGSTLLRFLRSFFVGLSWTLPLGLMLIGWYFFPPMREMVSLTKAPEIEIYQGMFVVTVLTIIWLISNWFTAMRYTTSGRELQVDCFVSTLTGIILTFIAGWLLYKDAMPWYFVIPWSGSIADTFITQYTAINNAMQKPLVQRLDRGG